ncbi:MAG: hypothetical protein IPN67_03205 [Bacteroidales bacterium]|nr:hypothetical protein [Bacteroidales bacterium]
MKNFIKTSVVIFLFLGSIIMLNSCDKAKDSTPPTLTTAVISGITQTTAVSGGNVTDDNGSDITVRGVCWSTTANPTTADSKTMDGTGKGTFVSNLSGLTAGTMYYVRAYATNKAGTAYGNEVSFTANSVALASLTSVAVTLITNTTSVSGGVITDDNGSDITARGVCWGIVANPSITDSHTTDGTGTGTFASNLTGLTAGTVYYVKAYATNSTGTAYGNELTFTTTTGTLASLTTAAVTAIAATTATSGGDITDDNGSDITAKGVCWSLTANPTIADAHTSDGTGTGVFVSNLTGLTGATMYYVKAYSTNGAGTSYGNEVTFTTL